MPIFLCERVRNMPRGDGNVLNCVYVIVRACLCVCVTFTQLCIHKECTDVRVCYVIVLALNSVCA